MFSLALVVRMFSSDALVLFLGDFVPFFDFPLFLFFDGSLILSVVGIFRCLFTRFCIAFGFEVEVVATVSKSVMRYVKNY